MNELSFVKHLKATFEAPGPYTSLYLNTETRTEQGPEELLLRWRALRETAEEAGARKDVLDTVDSIVDGSHRQGDGLALLASQGDILFRRYLRTPLADHVTFGPLPHLLPLYRMGAGEPSSRRDVARPGRC